MNQNMSAQSGYSQPQYNSQIKYHKGRIDDENDIGDEVGKGRDDRQIRTSGVGNMPQYRTGGGGGANSNSRYIQQTAGLDQDPITIGYSQQQDQYKGVPSQIIAGQQQIAPMGGFQQTPGQMQGSGIAPSQTQGSGIAPRYQLANVLSNREYELMQPQSPHNASAQANKMMDRPGTNTQNEKSYEGQRQYTQPHTQAQTQTNLLPQHFQQQQLQGQRENGKSADRPILLDQYGYPEGYKTEHDITLLIQDEKARQRQKHTHGFRSILHMLYLVILAISFAIFWVQLSKLLNNNYYASNEQYGAVVPYRKIPDVINNVMADFGGSGDLKVANYILLTELEGVWPSQLDQLVLFGSLAINLFLIQYKWSWFLFAVNFILVLKDFVVIIAWAHEQHYLETWRFTRGLSIWGILFARRPLGLPVVLAVLNILLIRMPMFSLGCSENHADIDSEEDLYALDNPEEKSFFRRHFHSLHYSSFGRFLVYTWFAVMSILLFVNFLVGMVVFILGIFGFFTLYFFIWVTGYVTPILNIKYAVRNEWYAKNYYLTVRARCSQQIVDKELQKAIDAHRTYRHRQNVAHYPRILLLFMILIFCDQYGSIWLKGGGFVFLERFIYASPFQFTFDVLTSIHTGGWQYVFRWLSAI